MRTNNMLTRETINRIVPRFLEEEGVDPIPDVKWGEAIVAPIQKLYARNKPWTKSTTEEVMAGVIEDLFMGTNLDTDCDPWAEGSIADQIKTWKNKGKSDLDIQCILSDCIRKRAIHKFKRVTKHPGKGPRKGLTEAGYEEENGSPEGSQEVYASRFKVDDTYQGLHHRYSGQCRDHAKSIEQKKILEKMDDMIENKVKSEDVYLLWKAFLQNPDISKFRELQKETVSYTYKGISHEETVQEALKRVGNSSFYYIREKLKDTLKHELDDVEPFI
jgi:hypothetical protein